MGWLNNYLEDKDKAEKQQAIQEKKRKSMLAKAKSQSGKANVARLRAMNKTNQEGAGMPTIEEEEDDDEEEGAVAAEFQLQWDDLSLSPSTWQKSRLRGAAEAMREELKPKLLMPTQLQAAPSNVKKRIREP